MLNCVNSLSLEFIWKNNILVGEIDPRGRFHQRVYPQLLRSQISKVQKVAWVDCLFVLLGSASIKAARKMMAKLTPGFFLNFEGGEMCSRSM